MLEVILKEAKWILGHVNVQRPQNIQDVGCITSPVGRHRHRCKINKSGNGKTIDTIPIPSGYSGKDHTHKITNRKVSIIDNHNHELM